MSKRRRPSRRRGRKPARVLFDRIFASLREDNSPSPKAASTELPLSPFGKPLARISDITAPFALGPVIATNRRSGAYYLNELLNPSFEPLTTTTTPIPQEVQKLSSLLDELPAMPYATLDDGKEASASSQLRKRGQRAGSHLNRKARRTQEIAPEPPASLIIPPDIKAEITSFEPQTSLEPTPLAAEILGPFSPFDGLSYTPRDMGLLAWTRDPVTANNFVSLAANTVYLTQIRLHSEISVSSLYIHLFAVGRSKHPIRLRGGLYTAEDTLLAQSESVNLTLRRYDRPSPSQALAFPAPQMLPPGIYTLALYCMSRNREIRLCAASSYRGHAIPLQGNRYRSARSGVRHLALPEKIDWNEFRPGNEYWFGLR